METDDAGDTERAYTATTEEYGDLVSEYDEGSGASSFRQYDAVGSTDALLDADETATDRYQYRAFGLETHESGTSDSPFTFVGKQNYYRDPELELYYLGMGNPSGGGRPYDPATGQFLAEDLLLRVSSVVLSAADINQYVYADNNPLNATDPSGQQVVTGGPGPAALTALKDLLEARDTPTGESMCTYEGGLDDPTLLRELRNLVRFEIGSMIEDESETADHDLIRDIDKVLEAALKGAAPIDWEALEKKAWSACAGGVLGACGVLFFKNPVRGISLPAPFDEWTAKDVCLCGVGLALGVPTMVVEPIVGLAQMQQQVLEENKWLIRMALAQFVSGGWGLV